VGPPVLTINTLLWVLVVTLPPYTRIAAGRPASGARPCVLVIGNFDGVHRGHQAVVVQARAEADRRGIGLAVLTFDPHPAEVLGRGHPPMLTTLVRKSELMRRLGVDDVYACTFDKSLAAWTPDKFARDLVKVALMADVVVVGENFRFGAQRAGDLALLSALGDQLGFDARASAIAEDAHGPFSSTRARQAVLRGNLVESEAVLGRRHALSGVVVRGDARGRTIGFPTANLDEVPELAPAQGVYAVVVDELGDGDRARALARGVMNVGVRPTVGGVKRTIESHLFDISRDLYDMRLRVHLVARLRNEQKFESLDALKVQIAKDSEAARVVLAAVEPEDGRYG
jgi:riboflavin kinase/FMN adenylyltransferase